MAYFEPRAPETRGAHQHGSRCYWDLRDCAWHCAVVPAVPDSPEPLAPAVEPQEPVEGSLVSG